MKRFAILLMLFATLGALPAAGQSVVGFFEGPRDVDADGIPDNSGSGAIAVTGWAGALQGVQRVVIQVDGTDVGQAVYGRPRPDARPQVLGFPDEDGPGFFFNVNTIPFKNGLHTITAKVVTNTGLEVVLPQSYQVNFINNAAILAPFGRIERPDDGTELYGTCDLSDPNPIYAVVQGWVLDLGMQEEDAGVGYVELMIDNALVYSTRTDCTFDMSRGGLTQCYGLPRLDIERIYPYAEDAPLAGFRFVLDVGLLIQSGWVQGSHKLKLRAGDQATNVSEFSEIKVNFFCQENFGDVPSVGVIEHPRPGRQYFDTFLARGWAVDAEGVDRVEVYIDGNFFTEAEYGVGSRPAVPQLYPGYPNVFAPVWRAEIDTTLITDGRRRMQVRVVDLDGRTTEIGDREFFVNNDFDD